MAGIIKVKMRPPEPQRRGYLKDEGDLKDIQGVCIPFESVLYLFLLCIYSKLIKRWVILPRRCCSFSMFIVHDETSFTARRKNEVLIARLVSNWGCNYQF